MRTDVFTSLPDSNYWPAEVKPLQHKDHEISLSKWLLALLPGEIYGQPVLHRHVDILLHLAEGELAGVVEGLRNAYATTRSAFSETHQPETITAALVAIAELGKIRSRQLEFVEWLIQNR